MSRHRVGLALPLWACEAKRTNGQPGQRTRPDRANGLSDNPPFVEIRHGAVS